MTDPKRRRDRKRPSAADVSTNRRQLYRGLKNAVREAKDAVLETVTKARTVESLDKAKQRVRQAAEAVGSGVEGAATFTRSTVVGLRSSAKGLASVFSDHEQEIQKLEHDIEAQGGLYRELIRSKRAGDTIFVGGEPLAVLLAVSHIPQEVVQAYEAAYPQMSQSISFEDKVRSLDESSLPGFLSAVKGKLFEQQYVDYLNASRLPDGYEATLANSANQPGWDIAVAGPDPEIAALIQAKATDSVSYVVAAMQQNPAIDVVTTDEVYSHLVLSGISEGIVNSGIANADLTASLEAAADAADLGFDFLPPWFTLAFIAFTSYKAESLSLYKKLELAGNRTGHAYLAYLIGGGVAAVTNTWWLGVLATVSSRFLSEVGRRKAQVLHELTTTYQTNRRILQRLKSLPEPAPQVRNAGT